MNIFAMIAEFNPFHNGHKYILDEINKLSDATIVIMSGNAVQRGDIAITDKHTRADIALKHGADLVIELPGIYAVNTAQKFAYGAIETLNATGVVSHLAFGSETGDISKLIDAAKILENEPGNISKKIQELMSHGMSFPAARSTAYDSLIEHDILTQPNNILAVEYLRALKYTNSPIKPYTIDRTNNFHSLSTDGNIISASAVRALIENGEDFSAFVPETDFNVYSVKALDNILTYLLRTLTAEKLSQINDVNEGLEYRLINAAKQNYGFDDIAAAVKSKRYTMSRIRRILLSVVTDLTTELCSLPPSYIRILGMNERGKLILKEMKAKATLPIITKTADFSADPIFEAEIRITEAAALCRKNAPLPYGREYTVSPIVVK